MSKKSKDYDNLPEILARLYLRNEGESLGLSFSDWRKTVSAQDVIFLLLSYWKGHFKSRDEIRNEQQKLVWNKASSVLKEVVAYKEGDDTDAIFSKMVSLCILLSGLGTPSSQPVIKETYPALQSVLKVSDLVGLAELPHGERQEHMLELAQIVMGIRLFNKDCLKGGAGIDDLPELLTRAVDVSNIRLLQSEVEVNERCETLTSALFIILFDLSTHVGELNMEPTMPSGFSDEDLDDLKAAICLARQQQLLLRELRKEAFNAKLHVKAVVAELRSTLVQLHETVRYRSAIPTIQVYPLFVQLSLVWREMQHETATLGHINEVLDTLQSIAEDVPQPSLEALPSKVKEKKSALKQLSFNQTFSEEVIVPKLRSFCPWSMVQTRGGLLPGLHNKSEYAFRSPEAAEAWFKDEEKSLSALDNILQTYPYLQLFLDATGIERDARIEPDLPSERTPKASQQDAEVQTELHPVPSHIDFSYAWNEWELKRQALRLARLTNAATRSQQTTVSGFRAHKDTQTTTP